MSALSAVEGHRSLVASIAMIKTMPPEFLRDLCTRHLFNLIAMLTWPQLLCHLHVRHGLELVAMMRSAVVFISMTLSVTSACVIFLVYQTATMKTEFRAALARHPFAASIPVNQFLASLVRALPPTLLLGKFFVLL